MNLFQLNKGKGNRRELNFQINKKRVPSERVGIETRTVHRLPGKDERDEFAPCSMRKRGFP